MATQIAAEVREFEIDKYIPKKEQRRMDPFCHYAVAAGKLAVQDAGLQMSAEDPARPSVGRQDGMGRKHPMPFFFVRLHSALA